MSKLSIEYLYRITQLIKLIIDEEDNAINYAASLMANAIEQGNKIFGFGCTHYSLHLQDIIYRAGGLMLINPMFLPGATSLDTHPVSMTSRISRLHGYAQILLDSYPIQKNDVLILVSVTGCNAVEVELAKTAQERGITVIGVTSRKYSEGMVSRHKSGKRMLDFIDVLLDDKVDVGDAVLETPIIDQKFSPVSGVTNIALLHATVTACIEELIERGISPPIYVSGNLPAGNEHNAILREKFRNQITY